MACRLPTSQMSLSSLTRRALSMAVFSALMGSPLLAAAQVMPDAAAGAQRPGTNAAANGVPVVNIVAPSAAGVSHNKYQQFNVDKQGLILNNSAGVSATQLGGYIVGNPNYRAGQSAKIIVNEVTSTNPTYLRGYMEVAGNGADVVIANPNGISVDGGGFINTSRATLTTGAPMFADGGSLSGFQARGGTISIDGDGLNASNIDRLDLIARSLTVNGGVWANQLNVVTGANQVNYSDLRTQAIAGVGAAPSASIDVAALGGMYANAVHLVANDAGVGVRNAGQLASQSGDFTVDATGQLQLSGTTSSAGALTLHAASLSNGGALQSLADMTLQFSGDITNTGTLYSGNTLALTTGGTLRNTSVIAADGDASLRAQQLFSTGTLGASVARDGSVQGAAALSLLTDGMLSSTGQNLAGGAITLQGSAINLSGAQTRAGGNIALTAAAGDIDHHDATLVTSGVLDIHSTGTVDNASGTLQAAQLTAQAADWKNAYGSVMQTGNGPMNVQIGGLLDNTHGTWVANANDIVLSAGTLDNTAGSLEQAGNGAFNLNGGALINDQGQLLGNGDLAIASQTVSNQGGMLSVAGDATLTGQDLDNTGGTVLAQQLRTQLSSTLTNQNGLLQAQGAQLMAGNLVNGNGQIKALAGDLDLSVAQALRNDVDGFLGSNAALHLQAGTLSNAGQLYAGTDLALTTQGDALNSGALQAQGNADLTIGGGFTNDDGRLQAGNSQGRAHLNLSAASISNQRGRIANSDDGATRIAATTLDNTGGTVGGQGDVTLNAESLTNQSGTLVAGGDFALQSDGLTNQRGTVYSAGALTWINANATLDNTAGSIGAGGNLAFTLGTVHNDGGDIASNNNLAAQFNGFDGIGRLRAGNNLLLTLASDYTNQLGNTLFANGDVTVNVGGAFTNAAGATLQSAGVDADRREHREPKRRGHRQRHHHAQCRHAKQRRPHRRR